MWAASESSVTRKVVSGSMDAHNGCPVTNNSSTNLTDMTIFFPLGENTSVPPFKWQYTTNVLEENMAEYEGKEGGQKWQCVPHKRPNLL